MNKYAAEKIASEYYDLGIKLALQKLANPTNDNDFVGPRQQSDSTDLTKHLSAPTAAAAVGTSGSSAQAGPQKTVFQQVTGLPFSVGRGLGAGYKDDQYSGYAPSVTGGNISGTF